MVVRLAGEFQAFARDLHDLASTEFASHAGAGNPALESVVRARLTEDRQLDRGNAQPGSLGSDFGRLGIGFWPALKSADSRTGGRQAKLEELNKMRNDIAHMNPGAVTGTSYAVTLPQVRAWDGALDKLASTMDGVLATHISSFFSVGKPW